MNLNIPLGSYSSIKQVEEKNDYLFLDKDPRGSCIVIIGIHIFMERKK